MSRQQARLYKEAAQKMAGRKESSTLGCCWAIQMVVDPDASLWNYNSEAHKLFEEYFKPEVYLGINWWPASELQERVLALLFMSEIAKDL